METHTYVITLETDLTEYEATELKEHLAEAIHDIKVISVYEKPLTLNATYKVASDTLNLLDGRSIRRADNEQVD